MEKIKNIRKKLRHQRSVRRRKLGLSTPTQIICVSFIIVIALGTPEGVGPMSSGDVVEVRIEGIGSLRNTVVDEA